MRFFLVGKKIEKILIWGKKKINNLLLSVLIY